LKLHDAWIKRYGTPTALLSALVALGAPPSAAAGSCEHAGTKPGKTSLANVERATRCLINKRRASHGLDRLNGNERLEDAATRHSRDMERRNYFSHTSAGGDTLRERVRRSGYLKGSENWTLGETLAWGDGREAKPRAIVKAWMHSPGHRATILRGQFRDAGVGVARGAPHGGSPKAAIFTVDFGRN